MYKLRIRDLREDADLNQTQIAEILNTSQTVYSRYEREERPIPVQYLITLAKYYNVSTDYILGMTDDPTPPQNKRNESREKQSTLRSTAER